MASRLLRWYNRHARDLPWRRTTDPYAIWISEVMLQQTRVETVRPYWERWMRRFPSLDILARARAHTVLKLWEGLGYYRRARDLHKTARHIQTQYAGRFPDRLDTLLQLPGIGHYTAGAVCSIAFNQPTPVLDGNVVRVLARLHGLRANPRQPNVRSTLWTLAEHLVRAAARRKPTGQPHCAMLNQGLMELGATLCTARTPRCRDCPWRSDCIAYRTGAVDRIPNLPRLAQPIVRQVAVLVMRDANRYLVRRQPEGARNAGLWEFPATPVDGNADAGRHDWIKRFGAVKRDPRVPWLTLDHAITRYRIRMRVYLAQARPRDRRLSAEERWCAATDLEKLAMSAAHRKIARAIRLNLA